MVGRRRRWTRLLAALLAAGTWTLGPGSVPVAAHTGLVASTPAAGEVVPPGPGRVELVFAEDLRAGAAELVVHGPDGQLLPVAAPDVEGPAVSTSLELSPGAHEVGYRVTAADGHPVVGQLSFTVATPGTAARLAARGTDPSVLAPVGDRSAPAPSVPAGAWVLVVLVAGLLLVLHRVSTARRPVRVRSRTVDVRTRDDVV